MNFHRNNDAASSPYAIGTPALDPYGTEGFISDVKQSNRRAFTIGATGLQPSACEYELCWSSGRISTLPDTIAKSFVDRAKDAGLPRVENVEERRAAIAAMQEQARAAAQSERQKEQDRASAFYADAEKRTPSWAKAVIVAELVEDQSDSMTDYFGSTTKRTVILDFSRHTRDLFPELRKAAAMFKETAHLAGAPESAEHREKYSMGGGYYLKTGFRYSSGWQVKKLKLYQGFRSIPVGEWAEEMEPDSPPPASAGPVEGISIEEHTHTKKGFQMFLCILPGRVDRAEYDRLLDAAKALGGWYSKPWGGTPGGFAFKDRASAEAFAGGGKPLEDIPAADAVERMAAAGVRPFARDELMRRVGPNLAAKFRAMADNLQSEIDGKLAHRLTNTPKRQREADSARMEGWRLQRTQSALRALADTHESGTVPPPLAAIRSKADVYALMGSKIDRSNAGYYDAGIDTNTPAKDTEQARLLWALIGPKSKEETKAEELRSKVQALQFANIPGYFPTPSAIVARMVDRSALPDGACLILEPSAGSGAIIEGIREAAPHAKVEAFERHASLRAILELKGVDLIGSDFTEAEPSPRYDRVLMNPPFENGQDIDHVMRAYEFLKEGGRLVAIMSPGPFFRSDRKAVAFREWFDNLNGWKEDLPAGAFKESGTGVATVIVTIEA